MELIAIRTADLRDLEASYDLEKLCFSQAEAASRSNMKKRIQEFSEGYLVAVIDNQIVGHLNSAATNEQEIPGDESKGLVGHDPFGTGLVISSLAVSPHHRKKGIAHKLLDAFYGQARQSGRRKVMLTSAREQLIPFYEKMGYGYYRFSPLDYGGIQWHEMHFEL